MLNVSVHLYVGGSAEFVQEGPHCWVRLRKHRDRVSSEDVPIFFPEGTPAERIASIAYDINAAIEAAGARQEAA